MKPYLVDKGSHHLCTLKEMLARRDQRAAYYYNAVCRSAWSSDLPWLSDLTIVLEQRIRELEADVARLAGHRATTNAVWQEQHPYHDDLHEFPMPPVRDEGEKP